MGNFYKIKKLKQKIFNTLLIIPFPLGGQDIYGTPYDTIERYDPELDEWNDLGLLAKPLKFHASVTTKNRYVIATGGHKTTEKNFWFLIY